jgi:hypothetical protein
MICACSEQSAGVCGARSNTHLGECFDRLYRIAQSLEETDFEEAERGFGLQMKLVIVTLRLISERSARKRR